ncbi:MAG: hypothetical protein N2651_03475 [Fimbriimonadales bacterium]|nr:hypothetical protein [Fimbriimonadales bacterium]
MRLGFLRLRADWAVVELARWDYKALELLLAEGIEVWVVGIPSLKELSFEKVRLSCVVRYAAREPSGLLTSPSTRWNGVIREVDIAPTLYRALTGEFRGDWSGFPAFEMRQSDWHRYWNGWLARIALRETTETVGIEWHGNALKRTAEWLQAREKIAPALYTALFVLYLGWLGVGIALWRAHWLHGIVRRVFVVGLAVFCLAPAVAIGYAYYPFEYWTGDYARDVAAIGSWLALFWTILSLAMAFLSRWGTMPLFGGASTIALGVITIDVLIAGGYGIRRSLLSASFGGDGSMFAVNEWFWGFGVASAILLPASWLESQGRCWLGARGRTALGMAYGLLIALLGVPMLGAALDAWAPATLALGFGIGIFTGIFRFPASVRQTVILSLLLLGVGCMVSALAVGLDALQPWQRQAGWLSQWWNALGWQFAPVQMLLTIATVFMVVYWLRDTLLRFVSRALVLNQAVAVGVLTALVALLLGKTIAAAVIFLMSLMATLEYLIGGKDWGYAYEGNGVAR